MAGIIFEVNEFILLLALNVVDKFLLFLSMSPDRDTKVDKSLFLVDVENGLSLETISIDDVENSSCSKYRLRNLSVSEFQSTMRVKNHQVCQHY